MWRNEHARREVCLQAHDRPRMLLGWVVFPTMAARKHGVTDIRLLQWQPRRAAAFQTLISKGEFLLSR